MITEFSKETRRTLKSYVYTYTDPRNNKVFYVGKGRDNRCFSEGRSKEFLVKIEDIKADGLEPKIDILASGLDDDGALAIEAAVIETYGIENLLNKAKGKDIRKRSVEDIERESNKETIDISRLPYKVLSISINKTYPTIDPHDPFALYEITRACWSFRSGPKEALNHEEVKYVLATYNDRILEVYKVEKWFDCNAIMHSRNHYSERPRWAFVGNIADEAVRKQFVNKLLPPKKQGEANPLKLYP